jgi:hypothetical protein
MSLVFMSLVLIPVSAVAQNTGIAGVVKDASGAVLPGVTVEASSQALIEKVRSVATDAQGLYQIVDLRPGRYDVTFSLTGFQTIKREGIDLTGSFTATVNAELSVGAVAETITVSGQAPMVDIHNVVDQKVLSGELRQDLPAARNVHNMAQLLAGTAMSSGTGRPSSQDVGGLSGDRGVVILHGSRTQDYDIQIDGSGLTYIQGVSQAQAFNPAEGQEYVYEMGALSAEHNSGGFHAKRDPEGRRQPFHGVLSRDLHQREFAEQQPRCQSHQPGAQLDERAPRDLRLQRSGRRAAETRQTLVLFLLPALGRAGNGGRRLPADRPAVVRVQPAARCCW